MMKVQMKKRKLSQLNLVQTSDYFNKKYIIWSSHSSLWVYYRMECLFLYFGRDIHSNFFEKLRDYFLLQQLDNHTTVLNRPIMDKDSFLWIQKSESNIQRLKIFNTEVDLQSQELVVNATLFVKWLIQSIDISSIESTTFDSDRTYFEVRYPADLQPIILEYLKINSGKLVFIMYDWENAEDELIDILKDREDDVKLFFWKYENRIKDSEYISEVNYKEGKSTQFYFNWNKKFLFWIGKLTSNFLCNVIVHRFTVFDAVSLFKRLKFC